MGNTIDSHEMNKNIRPKKQLSHTALGRYTTPNLNKNRNTLNKNNTINNKIDHDAKIYKEIFPPPRRDSRQNTSKVNRSVSNIFTSKIRESNISNMLDESSRYTLERETIKDVEREKTLNKSNSESNLKTMSFKNNLQIIKEENNIEDITDQPLHSLPDNNIVSSKMSDFNFNLNSYNHLEICDQKYETSEDNKLSNIDNIEIDIKFPQEKYNTNEINIVQTNDYELNFVKSGEDLRRSYIAKLIYKKVWQPTKKEKSHNTLIIFDWDDTLMCTSFLTPNGVFSDDVAISDKDINKIKKLAVCSFNILQKAINKGDTFIVTNAAPGWVEYSAKRFFPEVYKLLSKVTIVSARGDYEKKYPGDSRQWKILAFLEFLKTNDVNLVTNLICLGDSIIEMEAAHILASKFSQAFIKTIKFRESPKPDELIKQLNLVVDQFDSIFSAIKNLTIRVERKAKESSKDVRGNSKSPIRTPTKDFNKTPKKLK